MFEQTREILNKYEEIVQKDSLSTKDMNWAETYEFDMSKALYKELPSSLKIAKMICVMDDVDLITCEIK